MRQALVAVAGADVARARRGGDTWRSERHVGELNRPRGLALAKSQMLGQEAGGSQLRGAGPLSSKPQPQCLSRRPTPGECRGPRWPCIHMVSMSPPRIAVPMARGPWPPERVRPLARRPLPGRRRPRAAADAAIAGLRERGSPSHDGIAARLAAHRRATGSSSSCSRCAGPCGWSAGMPPGASRRSAWRARPTAAGWPDAARPGSRRGPDAGLWAPAARLSRREPGRHARARAARGVVGFPRARSRRGTRAPAPSS